MRIRILSVFVLTVFVLGCSIDPIFKISPTESDVEYYQGREIVNYTDSTASTYLNYECQSEGNFIFYIYAISDSENPFLVDPADIYYEVIKKAASSTYTLNKYYAVDPEAKLHSLGIQKESVDSEFNTASSMNCLFGVLSAAASLADDDENTDMGNAIGDWAEVQESASAEHEYNSAVIAESKNHWQNEVLRKTTLKTNDEIGGLFYLPVDVNVREFKLVIPLGASTHEFYFRQLKTN
ncbi:MAG: hypothetical protein KJ799_05140 [Bacteroidetes bacterium]|nr:hypothetical protein [Bacteroidota bacterium]MBU2506092.1 hypothetical protein [Bacteroidota bacterium]